MNDETGGWLWAFIDILMVAVLGGALLYGTLMWRKWRQSPREAEARGRATREMYKEP